MAERAVWTIHGEDFPEVDALPLGKIREVQRYTGRPFFKMDMTDLLDADVIGANIYLAIREKYPDRTPDEVATFIDTLTFGVDTSVRMVEVEDADPPTSSAETIGGQASSAAATTGSPSLVTSSGTSPTI